MLQIIFLAVAGALGALSRYALGGLVQKAVSAGFPYGTLVVNIVGCFVIGYVMQLALSTNIISSSFRVVITIGFLGAFTTFSTFSYETVKLIEDAAYLSAILNVASNVGVGLLATFLGLLLGRITLGGS